VRGQPSRRARRGHVGARPSSLLCFALAATAAGRLGLAAASLGSPTAAILLSYPLLNLGQGLSHTLLKTLMANSAAPSSRGLLLGALGSVEKSLGVVGPLLGGPAYERLGPAAPVCLSALFALIGVGAAASLAVEPPGSSAGGTKAQRHAKAE